MKLSPSPRVLVPKCFRDPSAFSKPKFCSNKLVMLLIYTFTQFCFFFGVCSEEGVVPVETPAPALGEPMDIMTALQLVLRKSLAHGGLVRGLHEAAKVIEKHAALLCVLAEDCNQPDYQKLVKALCADHNVSLVTVPAAKTLGEWAGLIMNIGKEEFWLPFEILVSLIFVRYPVHPGILPLPGQCDQSPLNFAFWILNRPENTLICMQQWQTVVKSEVVIRERIKITIKRNSLISSYIIEINR
ncbi:hypothetical protein R6Q57_022651 [Mikania cordata]